jgi:hypothetical protein
MNHIKIKAESFALDYQINHKMLNLRILYDVADKMHITILDIVKGEDNIAAVIIDILGGWDLIEGKSAYTSLLDSESKLKLKNFNILENNKSIDTIIFIKAGVPDDEKLKLILHEFGHIALKHIDSDKHLQESELCEKEADYFAKHLFYKSAQGRRKKVFRRIFYIFIPIFIVVSIILSIRLLQSYENYIVDKHKDEIIFRINFQNINMDAYNLPFRTDMRYVMLNAGRLSQHYHRGNCIEVQTLAFEIMAYWYYDVPEQYSPCPYCLPEMVD